MDFNTAPDSTAEAFRLMEEAINQRPEMCELYRTDFTTHDVNTIQALGSGRFLWCIRQCGTSLIALDTIEKSDRCRAYQHVEMYQNSLNDRGNSPHQWFYLTVFPDGLGAALNDITFEVACELANFRDEELNQQVTDQ